MDFGLFFLMQRDEAWSEQAVYESALEQMLAAEGLGYQSVWIAEHHFNDYGLCPAPPVLASYVAARTRTLRLGMGVSLLPLHHPVDLAEQLAVLDVVSGGRLDVGIGRGGTLQDYQTFQSDRGDSRARVEEGIALMREAGAAGRSTSRGASTRPSGCTCGRAPQRPHPPLFVASNSEDSVRSAARLGLPTLSSYFVPRTSWCGGNAMYRERCRGRGPPEAEIERLERQAWGMRVVHVAPHPRRGARATEAPFMGYQRRIAALRSEGGGPVPDSFDRSLVRLRPFQEYLDDGLAHDRIAPRGARSASGVPRGHRLSRTCCS